MIWRKYFPVIGFLLISISASAARDIKLTEGQLTHKGLQRHYLVHNPPEACKTSRPLPLLLAFHGGGGKARGFANYTEFNPLADQHCFIVVYPQGMDKHWHDARFGKKSAQIDDFGFIIALIDKLAKEHPVDQQHVYLTGMSNGGVFALQLAATLPERFAGVASVVAQLPDNLPEITGDTALPPLLMINGTEDPILPYQGGEVRLKLFKTWKKGSKSGGQGKVQSTDQTLAYWRKKSGITGVPVIIKTKDTRDWDGTSIEISNWQGNGNTVRLCKVIGGGHAWPGKGQYLPKMIVGNASKEIDATAMIWEFLSAQKADRIAD